MQDRGRSALVRLVSEPAFHGGVATIALGVSLFHTNALDVRFAVGAAALGLVVGLAKVVTSGTITGVADGVKCVCCGEDCGADVTDPINAAFTEVVWGMGALVAAEPEGAPSVVITCSSGPPLLLQLESASTYRLQVTVSAVVLISDGGVSMARGRSSQPT